MRLLKCCIAISLASGSIAAIAQAPVYQDKAKEVAGRVYPAYQALKSLHAKFDANITLPDNSGGGDNSQSVIMKWARPNKLCLSTTSKSTGKMNELIVSNGTDLWHWNGPTNTYTKIKAPALFKNFPSINASAPEFEALLKDIDPMSDKSMPPGANFTLEQPKTIGGVDVNVLKSSFNDKLAAGFNSTLLIYLGQKDNLIHGLEFSMLGTDPATKKAVSMKLEIAYSLFNAAPAFTDADFKFAPPAGAKLLGAAPAKPPVKKNSKKK